MRQRPWLMLGAALLIVGLLVRIALYFPLAMFPIDSDGVLAGLCAFRIADGHYPLFFPGGTRLSAASCYVAAAFFRMLGPGRTGLALTGLTWAVLYLLFTLFFLRATLGRKTACVAYLFAVVPSAAFVTVTYVPWAYGEIMASCAATLWLAALWRNDGRRWEAFFLGVSVGLGAWISLQTFMIAVPAIVWVVLKRRGASVAQSVPLLLGAVVGATPFWAGNVGRGFPSFTQNWASLPAASAAQIWDNLVWVTTSPLPQLLYYGFSSLWSPSTVILAAYAAIAVGFAVALRANVRDPDAPLAPRDAAQLLLLVVLASVLLYSLSQAGSIRGWTVRYIAPLYLVVPLFCGIGTQTLWRRSRWLAVAAAGAFVAANLLLYSLPGSAARAVLATQLQTDVRLRERLARENVRMVYGDYFVVYHLNFDGRRSVAGIPSLSWVDYFDYAGTLPTAGVRWALLGYYGDQLRRWADAVGAHGSMTQVGDLQLYLADRPASNAGKLLAALRRASR